MSEHIYVTLNVHIVHATTCVADQENHAFLLAILSKCNTTSLVMLSHRMYTSHAGSDIHQKLTGA